MVATTTESEMVAEVGAGDEIDLLTQIEEAWHEAGWGMDAKVSEVESFLREQGYTYKRVWFDNVMPDEFFVECPAYDVVKDGLKERVQYLPNEGGWYDC